MSEKNKNNRVRYIISQLKKEGKIENEGSLTKSSWIIKKQICFLQRIRKEFAKKIVIHKLKDT